MILCDNAQAYDGKLSILGGGWTMTGPGPSPMGIGALIEFPPDGALVPHRFRLRLRNTAGETVVDPNGNAIQVEGQFDFALPGTPPGSPIALPLAVNLPPLQLEAATRYVWELVVDDDEAGLAQVGFDTRPAPLQAAS